jgi:hypothetical protein
VELVTCAVFIPVCMPVSTYEIGMIDSISDEDCVPAAPFTQSTVITFFVTAKSYSIEAVTVPN